jgi:uncharacterized protein (TIGR00255 family)
MTGFGRGASEGPSGRWRCEAKSVNGRGLDLKLRTPLGWDGLEPPIRQAAQARFRRGSLQIGLAFERTERSAPVAVDAALLERLIAAGAPFVEAGRIAPARLDGLLALRGVLRLEETGEEAAALGPEQEQAAASALAAVQAALSELAENRAREGAALAELLGGLAAQLSAAVAAARLEAAAAPQAWLNRLRERLAQLGEGLDPARLAQEAALIAAKGDVTEELDRLEAHLAELQTLFSASEPIGRRLEFLAQELTREASTLCAKASSLALTRIGLDLKVLIDQFKEQASNVE